MSKKRPIVRARAHILCFLAISAMLCGRFVAFAPPAAADSVYVVTSTGDEPDQTIDRVCATASGTCTLRAAIQESSRDAQPSTINFAIPGDGPHTIQLTGHLPSLSDPAGGTTVDGYTQAGASPNSAAVGSNAVIKVQITADGPESFDGFLLTSADNVVRGFAVYNLRLGVIMRGANSRGNAVVGNFLGTDANATFAAAVRNSQSVSVVVRDSAGANNIGRPDLADRNIISGGFSNGVVLGAIGPVIDANDNFVQNNVIGLAPDGGPLPNQGHGIDVNLGGSFNLIGGLGSGMGNVISGNIGSGVEISHDGATTGNQVVGNRIGTDLTGTGGPDHARNGQANIHLEDRVRNSVVAYNTIGTIPDIVADGGIKVDNAHGSRIEHNRIGVGEDGTPISNGPYGVQVERGSTDTVIGPGNEIAHNNAGIRMQDDNTHGVRITGNRIHSNAGLGVDIAPLSLVNANDPGDTDGGPNGGANFPVLTDATPTQVRGTACAGCQVEVFEADSTSTDPAVPQSYGEGRTPLGSGTADGAGNFAIAIPNSGGDRTVTATSTDAGGNTSEFAANLFVEGTPDFAVDGFGRTVEGGWGGSEVGGPYTPLAFAGSFSVNGSTGVIETPSGRFRQVDLLDVDVTDVDVSMTVTTDRPPARGSHEVGVALRRVDAATMYVARLRYSPLGMLHVGVEVSGMPIGEVEVSGAPPPGTPLRLRAQITGLAPATIRAKTWVAGTTEPAEWAMTVSDATPALQRSGAIGVRATSAEMVGDEPVVVTIDDLEAGPVSPK